jgi:putative two-component system response regulator
VAATAAAAVIGAPADRAARPAAPAIVKQAPNPDPPGSAAEPSAGRNRGETRSDREGSRAANPGDGEYVLVVDDDPTVRHLLGSQLDYLGHRHRAAESGEQAIEVLRHHPGAVVVLSDVQMPGLAGVDLLGEIRRFDETIQVVMVSGHQDLETVRGYLRSGAYDYLGKPYELHDLSIAVERAIEHARLQRQNAEYSRNLERMVLERTIEVRETRDIALLTLAKLAESRDIDTGNHLERMAAYSRRLAEELRGGAYGGSIDGAFIEHLFKSSPLHDIGKVGLDDAILRKPSRLTPLELAAMRTHTTIGGDTLRRVIERHRGHTFLHMGMEIAYSHHERWDGGGYPAGLTGRSIPLAARIVALADAYDAITSARPYKPRFDHQEAVRRIHADSGSHFDPELVAAFDRCQEEFAVIRRDLLDGKEL